MAEQIKMSTGIIKHMQTRALKLENFAIRKRHGQYSQVSELVNCSSLADIGFIDKRRSSMEEAGRICSNPPKIDLFDSDSKLSILGMCGIERIDASQIEYSTAVCIESSPDSVAALPRADKELIDHKTLAALLPASNLVDPPPPFSRKSQRRLQELAHGKST